MIVMRLSRTLCALFPVVCTVLIAAIVPSDHPSVPLDDQSLSLVRGADIQFAIKVATSCDAMGVNALQQLYGGTYYQQSACNSVNQGQVCGGCTKSASANVGTKGAYVPSGTGQTNTIVAQCGLVQAGTCGVTNPNSSPPVYGCVGEQVQVDSNGNPYGCSNLLGVANQSG
jgi:hypothetical protein